MKPHVLGPALALLLPLVAQDPRLVVDLAPGAGSSNPVILGPSGRPGELLVAMDDGVRGNELWRTDGTAAGTTLLLELAPGPVGVAFGASEFDGHEHWFVADRGQGHELWRSDGTAAGTNMVFSAASIGATQLDFAAVSKRIGSSFLLAADGKMWISDGTAAGTQSLGIGVVYPSLVRGTTWYAVELTTPRVVAITLGSPPTVVVYHNAGLTSVAGEPVLLQYYFIRFPYRQVYTNLYAIERPGVSPVGPMIGELSCLEWNGSLVFADESGGLWRWDLANPEVNIATNVVPHKVLQYLGGRLMYASNDPATGSEPCITDGTAAGTQVLDLTPGPASTGFVFRGEVFRSGRGLIWIDNPATGPEPWSTDGTVAGTQFLAELEPGALGSSVGWTGFGGQVGQRRLVAETWTPSRGRELWVTDGTPAGSRLLAEIHPGPADGFSAIYSWVPYPAGHRLVFAADDGVRGLELWSVDLEGSTTLLHAQGSRAFEVSGDAVLGAQVDFRASRMKPQDLGAVAIGRPTVTPLPGPSSTHLFVDLVTSLPYLLIAPNAQGAWSQSVAVPNDAALQGLALVAQAGFAGPTIPGGVEFATAWWLCLGR